MKKTQYEHILFCLPPSALTSRHPSPSSPLSPLPTLDVECEGWASPRYTSGFLPLKLVRAPLTRASLAWAALSITGHRHTQFLTDPGERHSTQTFLQKEGGVWGAVPPQGCGNKVILQVQCIFHFLNAKFHNYYYCILAHDCPKLALWSTGRPWSTCWAALMNKLWNSVPEITQYRLKLQTNIKIL